MADNVLKKTVLIVAGVFGAAALLVGGAFFALYAFNPLGDEWVCSDGEAPAGEAPFYNQCFQVGATLPAGYSWDPFGNRPLASNCEKDGWVQIERRAGADTEQDCVRAGTTLPAGWRRTVTD